MRFSHSFCLLLTEFFLSIRTEMSVRSLPLCQIYQIFTINFQRYFRLKYKFCKIFEGSSNLHLRELGVLARARAISGPAARAKKLFRATLNIQFVFVYDEITVISLRSLGIFQHFSGRGGGFNNSAEYQKAIRYTQFINSGIFCTCTSEKNKHDNFQFLSKSIL